MRVASRWQVPVDNEAYRQYIDGMPRTTGTLPDAAASVVAIQQLGNAITRSLALVLAPHEITPQQWSLLTVVRDSDAPPSLASIARKMLVSKQNITGMIARMEQIGVIRRSGNPEDQRASRIELTKHGAALLETIDPLLARWSETFFGGLAPGDRKLFRKSVQALLDRATSEPES